MSNFDITKKYTWGGAKINVVKIYEVYTHTYTGKEFAAIKWKSGSIEGVASALLEDLVEVDPYSDWQIDDKIILTHRCSSSVFKRHFAGVDGGTPTFFDHGATSWSRPSEITKWSPLEYIMTKSDKA